MKKTKVLLLCGGKSAEHKVSLVSAKQVASALCAKDFQVELVFIDPKGRWLRADSSRLTGKIEDAAKLISDGCRELQVSERLSPDGSAPDVVFPVLHGPMGEDGTVQGLLELSGLPYVGCGVLGSAAGMDKEISKRLASQAGLPILPYAVIHDPKLATAAARTVGLPLFVKPARLGSSVGVSKVKNARQLSKAVKNAFLYDDKVILEKGLRAREIEVAVFGDPWSRDPKDPLRLQASVAGEIVPKAEFYTYESKYLDPDGAKLNIPADIPTQTASKLKQWALLAFRALDGYGMARADFLMDKKTGAVYFNELNTIPGFTPASMYPLLWKASGLDTPELLAGLVQLALRRHKARARLKTAPE